MIDENWSRRHITDSAQRILQQIRYRAGDRGLHVVDAPSIVMLSLWSLLLSERKIGRVALERLGVDPFDLAKELDPLLDEKAAENPIAFDERRQAAIVVTTGELYRGWDAHAMLEPLLQQAEHEALDLGHNYVGSEHLVLAIVRLAPPALSELLGRHGIVHEPLKKRILELLHS